MENKFYKIEDIFAPARNEVEIQSITNNDVYKFYMLDFILNHPEYKDTPVEWKMTIRSENIKTAEIIEKEELVEQLKAAQDIKGINEEETQYLENLEFDN
jgi:nicotinic acid phosphoribosyltransferase